MTASDLRNQGEAISDRNGSGSLRQTVEAFDLGVTVEPDSVAAIVAGLRCLLDDPRDRSANFARHRATTSWAVNVGRLLEVVEGARGISAMS